MTFNKALHELQRTLSEFFFFFFYIDLQEVRAPAANSRTNRRGYKSLYLKGKKETK